MSTSSCTMIYGCFKIGCMVATLITIGYWCYIYSLDEDICLVDYKSYHAKKEDTFPVMSLCFPPNAHLSNSTTEHEINQEMYKKFVNGKILDPNIEKMFFENLKLNFTNYIQSYWVRWTNGSGTKFSGKDNPGWKVPYSTYTGLFRRSLIQCYAIEITNNDIKVLKLSISNNVFPNGKRPYKFKFSVFFHARDQILRALPTIRSVWARRKRQFGYVMLSLIHI